MYVNNSENSLGNLDHKFKTHLQYDRPLNCKVCLINKKN